MICDGCYHAISGFEACSHYDFSCFANTNENRHRSRQEEIDTVKMERNEEEYGFRFLIDSISVTCPGPAVQDEVR